MNSNEITSLNAHPQQENSPKMSSEEVPTYDAVIIGGGLSGLTTAYLLRNKNILLLEKEADSAAGSSPSRSTR